MLLNRFSPSEIVSIIFWFVSSHIASCPFHRETEINIFMIIILFSGKIYSVFFFRGGIKNILDAFL